MGLVFHAAIAKKLNHHMCFTRQWPTSTQRHRATKNNHSTFSTCFNKNVQACILTLEITFLGLLQMHTPFVKVPWQLGSPVRQAPSGA